MTISEIRSKTGLSRAAFGRTYGIPIRTLEDWEAGKSNPPKYFVSALARMVDEDNPNITLKCYTPEMLRELGALYAELLKIINNGKHDPFPTSDITPIKYFMILHNKAMHVGVPQNLSERIARFMDFFDFEDFSESFETPVPMDLRIYFQMGKIENSQRL